MTLTFKIQSGFFKGAQRPLAYPPTTSLEEEEMEWERKMEMERKGGKT